MESRARGGQAAFTELAQALYHLSGGAQPVRRSRNATEPIMQGRTSDPEREIPGELRAVMEEMGKLSLGEPVYFDLKQPSIRTPK